MFLLPVFLTICKGPFPLNIVRCKRPSLSLWFQPLKCLECRLSGREQTLKLLIYASLQRFMQVKFNRERIGIRIVDHITKYSYIPDT